MAAEAKAKLSLNDIQFVRGMKRAMDTAKALAKQFAANPIKTTMVAAAKAVGGLTSALGNALKGLAKFTIAGAGLKLGSFAFDKLAEGIHGFISGTIENAARLETLQTTFETFLGSADKAAQHMEMLKQFASETPFELPEVAEASKNLEVLTGGLMNNVESLRLIGDAAAGTGRKFEDMAETIGRLQTGLKSGIDVGDQLRSLQEAGALTPEAMRRIHGAAGIDGAEAWRLAEAALKRFSGEMKRQSATWSGLVSNFQDAVHNAMAAFGAPILEALKPQLELLGTFIETMKPKIAEWGKVFASWLSAGLNLLEGAFANPRQMLGMLKDALEAAGHSFIAIIKDGLASISGFLKKIIEPLAQTFMGKSLGLDKIDFSGMSGAEDWQKAAQKWSDAGDKWRDLTHHGREGLEKMVTDAKPTELSEVDVTGKSQFASSSALISGHLKTDMSRHLGEMDAKGNLTGGFDWRRTFPLKRLAPSTDSKGRSTWGTEPVGPGGRWGTALNVRPNAMRRDANGSLVDPDSGKPYGARSLLSRRERAQMEQQVRAAKMADNYLKTGSFTTGQPVGRVRRGDVELARKMATEKQRALGEQIKESELKKWLEGVFNTAVTQPMQKAWGT